MLAVDGKTPKAGCSETRREETVKLMVLAMESMGFAESARTLEAESGISSTEGPGVLVKKLSDAILEGDWDQASALMQESSWAGFRVRYPVHRQHFLELLQAGRREEALLCLSMRLRPCARTQRLVRDFQRLSKLPALPSSQLQAAAGWEGSDLSARTKVRNEALGHVPGRIMPSKTRLFELLDLVEEHHRDASLFPYTVESEYSLLQDPEFAPEKLPRLLRTITAHRDEVWATRFSPSGQYLATGGKDRTVMIWRTAALSGEEGEQTEEDAAWAELEAQTPGLRDSAWPGLNASDQDERPLGHVVTIAAECQVLSIAWSPDESAVVLAGWDDAFLRVFAVPSGEKLGVTSRMHRPIAAAEWVWGSELCAAGGGDERLLLWNIERLLGRRPVTDPPASALEPVAELATGGRVVHSLCCSPDGSQLVALLSEQVIRVYDVHRILAAVDENTVDEEDEEGGGGLLGGGLLQSSQVVNPLLASLQASNAWGHGSAGQEPKKKGPPPVVQPTLEIVIPVDGQQAMLSVRMGSARPDGPGPGRILLNCIAAGGHAECVEWDLHARVTRQRYRGHVAERFVADSVVGGHEEMLVAGGSEDGSVMLWHRKTARQVKVLLGHTASVNQLDWQGEGGGLLATASDDNTVKVWGTRPRAR